MRKRRGFDIIDFAKYGMIVIIIAYVVFLLMREGGGGSGCGCGGWSCFLCVRISGRLCGSDE